jgi:hypothetical protein
LIEPRLVAESWWDVQRLLAARIRGLDQTDVLDRVLLVDAVDEDDAGFARAPGVLDDQVPELADGVELAQELALGVLLVELGPDLRARVLDLVRGLRVGRELGQEAVRHGDGDVVVLDLAEVVLEADELDDVRVVDAQDAHVGAAPEGALLDRVGRLENTWMKERPSVVPPDERTRSPFGRRRENEKPVPPPAFWISAVALIESKMPSIESSTGSTKHAESIPISRPAFISVGELGMNWRLAIRS